MLAWERWTLTHSSGCAVSLMLALGLVLPLGLAVGLMLLGVGLGLVLLGLGFAATYASREALATLAGGEGSPVSEDEPDSDGRPVGDGDIGLCRLGPALVPPVDAEAVAGPLADAELLSEGGGGEREGERVGEGVGDGVGVSLIENIGESEGDGEAVAGTGSAWH